MPAKGDEVWTKTVRLLSKLFFERPSFNFGYSCKAHRHAIR
jgi:hypothetical protein